MKILTLNCGSSSVKYMVYDWEKRAILCQGNVEKVTREDSFCIHKVYGKDALKIKHYCPTHKQAIELVLRLIASHKHGVISSIKEISAVGHRIVHGGENFTSSVIIDDNVLQGFRDIQDLAPLHNPHHITGIEAAQALLPGVPQVAVIDTSFHQTMAPEQYMYATPYEWYEKHSVRRYGAHGSSHLYVSRRAAVLLGKDPSETNVISLHIGNGASITAIKNGKCFDTSMGLTPSEGLIMGTRAGDIDSAIVKYIIEKEGYTPKEVDEILNKKSGVLGITGKYIDRREVIEAIEQGDERAQLALDMECYRIKKYIGSYVAALGRVDAIVWTAGVGEMASIIRQKSMEGLEYMGIEIDPEKNELARSRNAEFDISSPYSKVKIFAIPTDEELVMVEDVVALCEGRYDNYTNFEYSFQHTTYRNRIRDEEFKKELRKLPRMAKALVNIPDEYGESEACGTLA